MLRYRVVATDLHLIHVAQLTLRIVIGSKLVTQTWYSNRIIPFFKEPPLTVLRTVIQNTDSVGVGACYSFLQLATVRSNDNISHVFGAQPCLHQLYVLHRYNVRYRHLSLRRSALRGLQCHAAQSCPSVGRWSRSIFCAWRFRNCSVILQFLSSTHSGFFVLFSSLSNGGAFIWLTFFPVCSTHTYTYTYTYACTHTPQP